MKKKETQYRKYKFDKDGLCNNPDVEVEHSGRLINYKMWIAETNLGYTAGWYFNFLDQQLFNWEYPSKDKASPKKEDALFEAACDCYEKIISSISSPDLYKEDLNKLIEYQASLKPEGNSSSLNKDNTMAKVITAENPGIIPEAKFENIPLNKIVADPNQPRSFFDQHALDELRAGIIPVENACRK